MPTSDTPKTNDGPAVASAALFGFVDRWLWGCADRETQVIPAELRRDLARLLRDYQKTIPAPRIRYETSIRANDRRIRNAGGGPC